MVVGRGATHDDVPYVRVDIGLPHGIRQPQAGYPRALLGLDAVEHLCQQKRRFRARIELVFGIDGACTSSSASSVKSFCSDYGPFGRIAAL